MPGKKGGSRRGFAKQARKEGKEIEGGKEKDLPVSRVQEEGLGDLGSVETNELGGEKSGLIQ